MKLTRKKPRPAAGRRGSIKAEAGMARSHVSRQFYYLKAEQLIKMSHNVLCRSL